MEESLRWCLKSVLFIIATLSSLWDLGASRVFAVEKSDSPQRQGRVISSAEIHQRFWAWTKLFIQANSLAVLEACRTHKTEIEQAPKGIKKIFKVHRISLPRGNWTSVAADDHMVDVNTTSKILKRATGHRGECFRPWRFDQPRIFCLL